MSTSRNMLLAAGAFFLLATPALAVDEHHPPGATAQAAQPATAPPPQSAQSGAMPGSGGMMGGMGMMGGGMGMGMMDACMRMMGQGMMGPGGGPGMAGQAMAGPGMMGGGMAGPDAMIDRVEGRIAFLRTELKVTDAQSAAWAAFADALRANARKLNEARAAMQRDPAVPMLMQRLDQHERWYTARLEGAKAARGAFAQLYTVLSDEQKKTADELVWRHFGL